MSETIPQKDWCQTPPPDGWDKVTCGRIKADNGLGIYIADARQIDDPEKTIETRLSFYLHGRMVRTIILYPRLERKLPQR